MKKLALIILCFLLIVSFAIGIHLRIHQQFDGKILLCDEKMDFYIMDFRVNKLFEVDHKDYCEEFLKNIVLVKRINGKSILKIIYQNSEEDYFEVNKYVWGNPILINDIIYFVATDSPERYENAYLYSYYNGEINKVLSKQIDSISEIIYDDENLYFVEKKTTDDYIINRYSINDGKTHEIAKGRFPCWKEQGKTLFLLTGKYWDKLTVVDLTSNSNVIIEDDIDIVGSPKYDACNNLLLFHWDDHKATGAGFYRRISVLNLNNMKKTDISRYRTNIKINGEKITLNSLLHNSIYCEWVAQTQKD